MAQLKLGLANKVLILLCSVLTVMVMGWISFNHDNLANFYQQSRSQMVEAQQRQLQKYYLDVISRLQSITSSQVFRLSKTPGEQRTAVFRSFWLDLSDSSALPIRSLSVVEPENNNRLDYGYLTHSRLAKEWMSQSEFESDWLIDCQLSCRVLVKTELSLAEQDQPMRIFYSLDALQLHDLYPAMFDSHHFLVTLHAELDKVQLLYSASKDRENAHLLVTKLSPQQIKQGIPYILSPFGEVEVHAFVLSNTTQSSPVYYVVANDVSKAQAFLTNASQKNILFGLIALLFAMLIVSVSLTPSLMRVRHSINQLPLLARSAHSLFRSNLKPNRQRWIKDESDQLNQALIQLSNQLEELEQQLHSRAEELEWAANYDALTELPNRRMFERMMNDIIHERIPGCLLMVDLDNFKYVNDISGHGAGDDMLCQVAELLQRMLPENTSIARISGDEFVLFLDRSTLSRAEVVAQRIITMLGEISVPGHNIIHSVSVSVGVVAYPDHGSTYEDIMAKVDICINKAKEQGKKCFVSYQSQGISSELAAQHYWLDLAQHAIERNCLCLHFQAIMNNATSKIEHYEVLLRVQDQHGQLASPYQLILAAEKNGLIDLIDIWVVQQALDQMQRNLDQGIKDKLAINLSARSFCNSKVIARISREFITRNIPGELIIFEITETAALPNMAQAEQHIQRLKALGCAIALDDFGVGYSSFHSLKQLPFDYIKIDGSFVKGILQNSEDKIFIKALVNIADQLGHKTVAEFVESEELNEELKALGVNYSQGYFIGKPAAGETIWLLDKASDVLAVEEKRKGEHE